MPIKITTSNSVMNRVNGTAEHLRNDINKGVYAVGQKLAGELILAKQYGVSRSTLRQALDILSKEMLISRHPGRGTFVSHPGQISDTKTTTNTIGVMIYLVEEIPFEQYFFGDILKHAFQYAATRGYLIATAPVYPENIVDQSAEIFIETGVKGVVMSPLLHSRAAYNRLIEEKIPVVLLDTRVAGCNEDFVGVDDLAGMEMAARHLIELGHTRIVYAGPEHPFMATVRSQGDRYVGCTRACVQSGLQAPEIWRVEGNYIVDDDSILENIKANLRGSLSRKNRPTAIVTFNDIIALQIILAAQDIGLKVPDDLSVVGFDNSQLGKKNNIPITTVNPKPEDLGETAVDLLISKIANGHNNHRKHSILITPELIIRESTAKPKGVV